METLTDREGVRKLKDAEGHPFLLPIRQPELRLIWEYCMDGFSRDGNLIGKQKYSNGMQIFMCKNLPPSMAHRPENLFLAAIIPGSNEPKVEEMSNFMEPVLEQINDSYV